MPTIKDFGRFKITMYFGDENPPHFHVIAGDDAAKIDIRTLDIMKGSIPAKIAREAREWAAENRDLLLAKWSEYK